MILYLQTGLMIHSESYYKLDSIECAVVGEINSIDNIDHMVWTPVCSVDVPCSVRVVIRKEIDRIRKCRNRPS